MASVETRSFEELVKETTPDVRWENTVADLLRDIRTLSYFAEDGKTSWDPQVARSRTAIAEHNQGLKINRDLVQEAEEKIARSRLDPKQEGYLVLSKKERSDLDRQYALSTDAITEHKSELAILEPLVEKMLWSQYVERRTDNTLRYLRNKFMNDRDEDFLRRGVTWAYTYKYKLLELELPKLKLEPNLSAW